MPDNNDFFRVQNYYRYFSHCSLPAVFVPLTLTELASLKNGEPSITAVARLAGAMERFPGKRFISTDYCSPTDSERFLSYKRGAVISAESAWRILTNSTKVMEEAAADRVSLICVRPFKVFDIPREFRLFIHDGVLVAMSQRFLIRHFYRLDKKKGLYWNIASAFYNHIRENLPVKDLTIDIYITFKKQVLVVDVNPWGAPTDPLMLNSWDLPVTKPLGCLTVPPPQMISGDVNVSF